MRVVTSNLFGTGIYIYKSAKERKCRPQQLICRRDVDLSLLPAARDAAKVSGILLIVEPSSGRKIVVRPLSVPSRAETWTCSHKDDRERWYKPIKMELSRTDHINFDETRRYRAPRFGITLDSN